MPNKIISKLIISKPFICDFSTFELVINDKLLADFIIILNCIYIKNKININISIKDKVLIYNLIKSIFIDNLLFKNKKYLKLKINKHNIWLKLTKDNYNDLISFGRKFDYIIQTTLKVNNNNNNNNNNKSKKIKEKFEVILNCESEIEQQKIFEKLIDEGYSCRVLTY